MHMRSLAARERELYRYYQPDNEKSSKNEDGTRAPKASTDPILTAFAQLGALRLNTKRGIITLSTGTSEFMLAESGKALLLQQENDEGDKLWHGVGTFKCQLGKNKTVGAELVDHFCNSEDSCMIVNDMTKHDMFKDKCVVTKAPNVRFLAAVPLRTPGSHIVIGNYIVADDVIREEGLTEAEIAFMMDMGVTVMDYLQAGLIKKKQHRSERMIKAVSLFIEGKSTLRDWWLEWGHMMQHSSTKKNQKGPELEKLADAEFGVQEPINNLSKQLEHWPEDEALASMPQTPSSTSAMSRNDPVSDGRPIIPRGDSHVTSDSATQSTLLSKSWKDRNSSVTTFDASVEPTTDSKENRTSVSFDLPPAQVTDDATLPKELQDALLSSELKAVFSRASNLIREAIGVQGVIFYDASIGSFGASTDRGISDEKAPGAFQMDQAPISSEDEVQRILSVADVDVNGHSHSDSGLPSERPPEKCCNILGFSTRKRSSLRGHGPSEEYGNLPESIMRRLLKRYPHGKIFNFDQNGSFSSSDSDNNTTPGIDPNGIEGHKLVEQESKSRRKRLSKEAEAKAILKCLPGARSVFWFPLWDQTRERWFSGSLIWSTCPTRVLCPMEDLAYLAAFGNSAMAEVARISAQVLDKMKSDFISSISHELRSPLHGVLASVEFLQETQMTEVQEEMVNNIHASGKVLLDTINHVLDFSKVNRRSKNKTSSLSKRARSRKKKGPPDRAGAEDEEADTADILTLSEEVIESIYAGHSVGKPALSPSSHRSSFIASKEHAVNVITEFKYHPNWTFEIDPGAWSRILMNLFSNALKYTKTGFVKISMHVESEGVARSKKSRNNLVLKVRDSGKGISEEFLKHRLFKPFTQEDSLATGTGLGLSIVRHIVQDLEGTIVYTSEQGTGTEVTVRLPLAEERPVKAKDADVVAEVRKVTKGFKYRLEGFDRYPDIAEAPTGILSAEAEAAMLLKSSSSAKLTEWFGMEQSTNPKESGIDVIVIMEAGVPEGGVKDILDSYDHSHPSKSGKSIAVVLCNSYRPGPKMHTCGEFQIFYMHQPIGPHKSAKYLHAAFCEPHPQIPAPENHPVEKKQSTEMFRPVDLHPKEKELSPNSTEARDFEHDPTITLSPTEPEKKETEKRSKPTSSPTSNTPEQNGSTIFQPQSPTETTEPTTLRVLLVEDNEINLKLLVATMRKLKIKHFTATNGLEALNVYKEHHGDFDVIFMDISMPIMSGIESARHIRRYEKEEGLRATKLIALTGAANPRTRQEAFSVGVDLYLTKPVPMRELRGMLEEFKGE